MPHTLPIFETERLILKGVTLEDVPAYTRHFVDYDVVQHLSSAVPWPYPKDGVTTFLRDHILPHQGKDVWVWGIFLKENPDELIGAIDLQRKGAPDNRGFWLGKKFWGKGLMTEALQPVMDYAFSTLSFEKMTFSNAFGNAASRRIKEKTGARLIRTEPASFVNPAHTMREVWEMDKKDWKR